MQRVKRSTAVAVLPAAPAGGTPGYFSAPNPQGGVPATVPGYEWYNAVQEELVSIALASGLALDPSNNAQVLEALKRIFGGHMTTINGVAGGTTVALTLANAGLIVIDATNGNVTITLPTANALAAVALRFVRIDGTANIVTILRAGTDMIDNGLTSILLGWQGATQSLAADGVAKWLSMVPTTQAGEIGFFAQSTAPAGYLKANGSAISRTTYAVLFTAIGTIFGVGDGSTTFNVPDLRGEFIRGWDDSRGVDSGRGFGSWQADGFKSHTHAVLSSTTGAGGSAGDLVNGGGANQTPTIATGGTETRPRNVALLACIKY